ncbi:hypothetical protein MD484_g1476, partial [Candolleomyces efflorescens]
MSEFGESELSDLESSNDEYTQSSAKSKAAEKKKAAAKKAAQAEFAIKGALKPPRPTTYTTQALYDGIVHSHINLDADYQRDVVWNDVKQSNLIGSIFQNYYVPPIIFATQPLDDGSEIKVCIDGKQRLTSMRRFMDGLIPHKDPISGERWFFKDIPGSKKSRNILPDRIKRTWFDKQIVCVEYQDITDENEREIFQRVQLGMALTPAERMQGHNTPRCRFVRHLVFKHITEGLLAPGTSPVTNAPVGLDWAFSRGADFRCIASVVFYLDKEGKKIPDGSSLEPWLRDSKTELDKKLMKRIEAAFEKFEELVQSDKYNSVFKLQFKKKNGSGGGVPGPARSKPKVSPVEFVGTALLICAHQDKMSLKQLSACVGRMRKELHRDHLDLRLNTRVLTDVGRVIRECEADADMPVANEDDEDEDEEEEEDIPLSAKGKTPAKRKRKQESDEDDAMDGGGEDPDTPNVSTSKRGPPKSTKKKHKPTSSSNPPPLSTPTPVPALPSSASSRITALKQARASLPSFTKNPTTTTTAPTPSTSTVPWNVLAPQGTAAGADAGV